MRLTKGTCARVPRSRPSSPLCSLAPVIYPLFPLTSLVSCFSLPFRPSTCSCADPSKTKQHPHPAPPLLVLDNHSLVFLTSFFSSGRSAHGHNRLSPTCGLRSQTLRILPSCDPTPDSCLPTERSLDVGILKFSLFFSP